MLQSMVNHEIFIKSFSDSGREIFMRAKFHEILRL